MCGLIAMVLKTTTGGIQSDVSVFSDMLYMDALRGWDATGVGMYNTAGEMSMLKEALPAPQVMAHKSYERMMKDFIKDGKALIGHNRKATIGKISDATSHPFVIEEEDGKPGYLFMHNGTLRNWDKLVDGVTTEVDSEMLGTLLARCNGDKAKIEEALGKVTGAYACIWFDQTQDNMYIVRNSERPLIMGVTNYGVLVSSEIGIMAAAAQRNNTKIERFVQVDPDTLYTIGLEKSSTCEIFEEKLTIKKYMPPPSTTVGRVATSKRGASNDTTEGDVSKNRYKKIREEFIGTTVGFWLDDYEPRVIGDAHCKDWLIFGLNDDDHEFNHRFEGVFSGVEEHDLTCFYGDIPFYGKIEDVIYNKDTKSVTFRMTGVKTMEPSTTALQ